MMSRAADVIGFRDLKSRKTRSPNEPKFNVSEYVEREKQKDSCCGS